MSNDQPVSLSTVDRLARIETKLDHIATQQTDGYETQRRQMEALATRLTPLERIVYGIVAVGGIAAVGGGASVATSIVR